MRSSPDGATGGVDRRAAPGASSANSGQDASQELTSERRAAGTTIADRAADPAGDLGDGLAGGAFEVLDGDLTRLLAGGRTASGRSAPSPTRSAYAAA